MREESTERLGICLTCGGQGCYKCDNGFIRIRNAPPLSAASAQLKRSFLVPNRFTNRPVALMKLKR